MLVFLPSLSIGWYRIKIQNIKLGLCRFQNGDHTYTGQALTKMAEDMFDPKNGARPQSDSVPRVCIVITDGKASRADPPEKSAENARSKGILIIAIGVGNNISERQLDQIANKPSDRYSIKNIDGYEDVGNILERVLAEASIGKDTERI